MENTKKNVGSFGAAKLQAISFRLIAIALVAVIGFTMAGCKNDEAKTVSTNFRFRNAVPPASLNKSVARSVMGGTTSNTGSYSTLTAYYGTTKANLIQSVTPAAFKVYESGVTARVTGIGPHTLNSGTTWRMVDFVQGVTLNMPDDVPGEVNVTGMLILYEYGGGGGHPYPTTTFTVDTALAASHPLRSAQGPYPATTLSNSDRTITVPTVRLFPPPVMPGGGPLFPPAFQYSGTVYKYENSFSDVILSGHGGFVTPWAGYTTPSSGSITFNVNWDVSNLIQQRCNTGSGGSHACTDCVYVLADKFWEKFSMTVN
jgi:hypothetical protein